jgi:hypothetical protein
MTASLGSGGGELFRRDGVLDSEVTPFSVLSDDTRVGHEFLARYPARLIKPHDDHGLLVQ